LRTTADARTPRFAVPRPGAAWLMSLVASATLWITGELELWVIPVQLLCFAVSYSTRSAPPTWRLSPVWLNVGMLAITSITIAKALQGSPATLSLAYFAALSQGLQLLDARPRKSEFLLVALALFQVILASNLTDSVFFPPLVLIFVVAVTWTLLIHMLRIEAALAGDLRGAEAGLTPDLKRTTAALSLVSIVLALGIFMLLPRMKTSMLRGNLGSGFAVSGFSDHISLGAGGRIRQDGRVVMRVETLEGEPAAEGDGYWRGLAFDRFDGWTWSISPGPGQTTRNPVTGIPRFGVTFGAGPGDGDVVERIVREPVEAGVLFGAGSIKRIEGPMQYVERDPNGGLYHPAGTEDRVRYTLWTSPPIPRDARLERDHAALPRENGPRGSNPAERYLTLPSLDPAIARLAAQITATSTSDVGRLARLEEHLRRHGRYTDDPPERGNPDAGRTPVEDFLLGDLAGHCEYFASAMVVMSRSLGLPARLVNGFAGGRRNAFGGFTELSHADAHAWVEVHFADAGWVRFDPTPPDLRWQADGDTSLLEGIAELASVIELWWFQRVVDFDSSDQILALQSAWLFGRNLLDRFSTGSPRDATTQASRERDIDVPGTLVAPGPLALTLALLCLLVVAVHRRGRTDRVDVAPHYRRALRLLARHRIVRDPVMTARQFCSLVRSRGDVAAGRAFERITDDYLARRFGGRAGAMASDLDADLDALRASLRGLRRSRGRSVGPQRAP
jgi:transglutaminase-like putative cysteine protease